MEEEILHLSKKIELTNSQVGKLANIKNIAEQQMEEALQTL